MYSQFKPTGLVNTSGDFSGIKPGQWVKTEMGQRGQFLGVTRAGAVVIRWQSETPRFTKADALNNRPLRQFAKTYGSK